MSKIFPDKQDAVLFEEDGRVRLLITVGWFAIGAGLFRYWDLTIRVETFLLWTAVFIGIYAMETIVLQRYGLLGAANPWSDVWLWSAFLAIATIVQMLFPVLVFPNTTVQTVALFRVFDIILPLWILHRGVFSAWQGRTRIVATVGMPVYLLAVLWFVSIRMPLRSFEGMLPSLSIEETAIRDNSQMHVRMLADSIGARGSRGDSAVSETVRYLRGVLESHGYLVEELTYAVGEHEHRNLQVTIHGTSLVEEIVIVGAHYDTHDLTPGADDNATGVAGLLEIARLMAGSHPTRTIRFVLFGTEEPPYFNTDDMGSRHYAGRSSEAHERIVAMYSLEMLGYFSDEPGSQRHPPPLQLFFPDRGNFIMFVGNPASGRLLRRSLKRFRESKNFPSEGIVSSSMVPGVELSDHGSFWRRGFPAVLITDTGPFRNEHYHLESDTPDRLDFERMARVISGVRRVIEGAAGS